MPSFEYGDLIVVEENFSQSKPDPGPIVFRPQKRIRVRVIVFRRLRLGLIWIDRRNGCSIVLFFLLVIIVLVILVSPILIVLVIFLIRPAPWIII